MSDAPDMNPTTNRLQSGRPRKRLSRSRGMMMIAGIALVVSSMILLELHSRTNVSSDNALSAAPTTKERVLSIQDEDSSSIIPSRIFVPWTNAPCILDSTRHVFDPKVQRSPSTEGLLFIKNEKAASTTLAGVAARISHKLAVRHKVHFSNRTQGDDEHDHDDHDTQACTVRLSHLWSKKQKDQKVHRDPQKSFAFTFIKEPTKRILSLFYFFNVARASSKARMDPTDENVKKSLHKYANTQWQSVYLEAKNVRRKGSSSKMVNESLHALNFIGIVERLDESLVLLQLLLDLETSDILYATSSKQTGGYVSNDYMGKRSCTLIPSYNTSPAIQEYIHSEEWKELVLWDNLFYQAVNQSLDRSIQAIGKDKFQKALQNYRHAMQKVQEHCTPKLACSVTGEYIPKRHRDRCYWSDIGCGYECLDELFE